jgi:type 1 fimbria pilin
MNKVSIIALLTCSMTIPTALAEINILTPSNSGKVNFSGFILTNSCRVEINDKDKHVRLPPQKTSVLSDTIAQSITPFTISVKDCPSYGHWGPKLVWEPDFSLLTRNGYLKNRSYNGAENVALVILHGKEKVNLKDRKRFSSDRRNSDFHDGQKYHFEVGYIIAHDSNDKRGVTSGPVTAQASYRITYL